MIDIMCASNYVDDVMKLTNKSKTTVRAKGAKATTINNDVVLHVVGSKGSAFRLATSQADGSYKLKQDCKGLTKSYDGAIVSADALASGKLDKQAKLELGTYIASKGTKVTFSVLSLAEARKLANKVVIVSRNGTDCSLLVNKVDAQYCASIEMLKNGTEHFFQLETVRIKGRNERHYGALLKG